MHQIRCCLLGKDAEMWLRSANWGGNANFSILAIKGVKIVSNMEIKCCIPQAGNWVTLSIPTRNQLALMADEVFLLHK